jgi:integrase
MPNIETIKYLTTKEVETVMKKITSKRDLALFSLMYFYGLRCSEVSRLRLEDIRIGDNRINILASKNGLKGEHILNPVQVKNLVNYLKERNEVETTSNALFVSRKHGHLSGTHIRRLFQGYAKKAKISKDKRHPHVLRHSIAVHMAESETPVEHVRLHLRHREIKSTMVYFEITDPSRHRFQAKALGGEFVAKI